MFYLVFEGNFPSTVHAPRRLILGGAILRRVFWVTGLGGRGGGGLRLEGLIFGILRYLLPDMEGLHAGQVYFILHSTLKAVAKPTGFKSCKSSTYLT